MCSLLKRCLCLTNACACQCRMSSSPNRTASKAERYMPSSSGDMFSLTTVQKNLIRKTWKDDFDTLYELGTSIYSYIFQKAPDAKKLFPTAAAAGDNWRESGIFKTQALRFIRVLSQVVSYLHHPENIVPILMRIGYAHQKYQKRGFQPKHWDIFQEAVQVVLSRHIKDNYPDLTPNELESVMSAWAELSIFIIKSMKRGFYSDKKTMSQLS